MADTPITRTPINEWSFKTKHAQDALDILTESGQLTDFVSGESVVLAAGPAAYKDMDITKLFPIGLCDSVNLQQNTNIMQLYELGSRLPYIIPGRTQGQLQLNRVVFNGDSLMGALTSGNGLAGYEATSNSDAPGLDWTQRPGVVKSTNNGAFLLNLASSFFKKPFGLAILIQDSDTSEVGPKGAGQYVTGLYVENCLIQSHQLSMQSQQFLVMESALVRYTNLVPMAGLKNPS